MNNIEKKNTIPVLLLTSVLICISLVGYIVYDKLLANTNRTETEEKNETEEKKDSTSNETQLSTSDPLVQKLYTMVKYTDIGPQTYYSSKKIKATDLYIAIKLEIAYRNGYELNAPVDQITNDEMKTLFHKTFGSEAKYEAATFSIDSYCKLYEYDEKKQLYTFTIPVGCGGLVAMEVYAKIDKATKTEDKIEIYEKFIVKSPLIGADQSVGSKMELYTGCDGLKLDLEIGENISLNNESDAEAYFKKYEDKLYYVKYTYVKNIDNSYYFSGTEIIKQ